MFPECSLNVHLAQAFLKNMLNASHGREDDGTLTPKSRTALKCLCATLIALPHFNYRTDLLSAVLPKASDLDPQVHVPACEALKSLCRDDTRGEAALVVAATVKQKNLKVPAAFIEVFLSLRFDATLRVRMEDSGGAADPRKV
jgi:nucleolar complex protein 3